MNLLAWKSARIGRKPRTLLELEALEARLTPSAYVNVNTAANVHAIDPDIYGAAFATTAQIQALNLTINREGGNASDTYNWQADASNHASDWYYESIAGGSGDGQSMDAFVSQTNAGGAAADLTIPILPYVASLGPNGSDLGSYPVSVYGSQQSTDPWYPNFGNGVTTSGQNITDTNPLYNYVANSPAFEQGWIQHLLTTFGTPANGGVQYFTLGNEPGLWNSTHMDIHPNGETNTELLDDIINYGSMIKSIDPSAQILGPEEWGWTNYFVDGADAAAGNYGATYTGLNGQQLNAEQWLLQQLDQYQAQHGTRLLDYFTLHYYPQESVNGDYNGGVDSDNVDQATELLRNQVTRSLWDPNYVDPSWIASTGINGGKVDLIPMMQSWVNQYYPGTKTGITEYNFGADDNMNGATTQADLYGIFGQQGLNLATRWGTPATGTPTYLAMQLWRNYDGKDSGFGNISVGASVANPDDTDAFAAIRSSDGALTVAVINKNLYNASDPSATTPVTVNLSGFAGNGVAQEWQLAAINPSDQTNAAITHLANVDFTGNSFTINVPMESVTMFVIEPGTALAPKVSSNPTKATVFAGQGAVFNAVATGTPAPSVQWQVSSNGGKTFTNVAGANANPYTFTAALSQNGDQYRAVFTNSAGTATTSAATLTVDPATAPRIVAQPVSRAIDAGQSTSFTVAVAGTTPLAYQWQKLVATTWTNVGTNSATCTITAAATTNAGDYRVVVTNVAGSVTSNAAVLTVDVIAPRVTKNPLSQTVFAGQTVQLTASAGGAPPPTVQWQVSTNGGKTFANISGATATGYSFTAGINSSGDEYRATFTNSAGSAASTAATVTVHGPGVAINAGGTATAGYSADVAFTGGTVHATTQAIDTSGVANAAPQAVYQTWRSGYFYCSVLGLKAGGSYTIRLLFSENTVSAAGLHEFNVAINGALVLKDFDIYATAGAEFKAVTKQFTANANSGGGIAIGFAPVKGLGQVNGIEVLPAAAVSQAIDAGGATVGAYAADSGFTGGTAASTSAAIGTSAAVNPASEAVYQSERYGDFTYTLRNLLPGATYTVGLDFAEIYWTSPGQRVFNVQINGTQVLTNFDIIAATGAQNTAIDKTFTATADSYGDITINFISVVNYAKVSGIAVSLQ